VDYDEVLRQCPLRVWRKANKFTAARLALRLGASAGALASWERGVARPNHEFMEKIEEVCGVSAGDIEDWMYNLREVA